MTGRQPFADWWPLAIRAYRKLGGLTAVQEVSMRYLYDLGFSPKDAADILIEKGLDDVFEAAKTRKGLAQ